MRFTNVILKEIVMDQIRHLRIR